MWCIRYIMLIYAYERGLHIVMFIFMCIYTGEFVNLKKGSIHMVSSDEAEPLIRQEKLRLMDEKSFTKNWFSSSELHRIDADNRAPKFKSIASISFACSASRRKRAVLVIGNRVLVIGFRKTSACTCTWSRVRGSLYICIRGSGGGWSDSWWSPSPN